MLYEKYFASHSHQLNVFLAILEVQGKKIREKWKVEVFMERSSKRRRSKYMEESSPFDHHHISFLWKYVFNEIRQRWELRQDFGTNASLK